jgi:histidine ammonia-lyase
MGMAAAVKLKKVIENTRNVIAVEAMAAAQAMDFLLPLKPSKRGQTAYQAIRAASPVVKKDRILSGDIAKVASVISSGELARALGSDH